MLRLSASKESIRACLADGTMRSAAPAASSAGGVRRLVATDIDPHAVRADRADGVDAVHADLLLGIRGRFDLVLFNAPYLPTGPEERTGQWIDQALDGGASGT